MKTFATTLLGAAIAAAFLSSPSQAYERPGARPAVKGAEQPLARPTDRVIIKFRDGLAAANTSRQATLAQAGEGLDVLVKSRRVLGIGAESVKLNRRMDRVEMDTYLSRLRNNPAVEYAVVDRMMKPVFTPNDSLYPQQWHYANNVGGLNLPSAWDLSLGAGTVVAVIDTGIVSHSDLNSNVLPGYDFIIDTEVSNDGNGRDGDPADPGDWVEVDECEEGSEAEDSSWHGTHVAGTVAAVTNNTGGVAGVAPSAKIVPLRVLGKCGGYTSDIADAILWAAGGSVAGVPANANPAEVINMSLGGGGSCDLPTQVAINSAVGLGSVVVVAAGNSNSSVEDFSPASCNNVISVASNDDDAVRSAFSNAGDLIDVSGPGGEPGILSTYNEGTTVPAAQGYAYLQGTSMASPHVAGVVALMQAESVNTPARVEEILKLTAKPMVGSNCAGLCGAGKVDAYAALRGVNGLFPAPPREPLLNGLGKPLPASDAGTEKHFVMTTYNVLSNVHIASSGGTGNLDMYVKFGSAPTTSSYDCRSDGVGNAESCNFPVGQVGNYFVMIRGTTEYSGATLYAKHPTTIFVNQGNQAIRDMTDGWLRVPVLIHGRTGNMSATTRVTVNIRHSYVGDLEFQLQSPNNTIYPLQANQGGATDDINMSFTVDASSEPAERTWFLRVKDEGPADVGHVDQWSIKM